VQDTGCSPQRVGWGSAQSSDYDTEDSRYIQQAKYVRCYGTQEQISLVTHQYAREAGFKGRPASIQISGVGSGNKNKSKVQFRVLLRKRDGGVAEFTPYGVEKITGDAVSIYLHKARSLFRAVADRLVSPDGPIHMFVSVDHMKDAPREQPRKEGVVLYQSEFSTGHVVCGNMGGMVVEKGAEGPDLRMLSLRSMLFNPPEFILAEVMGKALPRRVLLSRTAKSVSSKWKACRSRRTPSTG
jgi:hypothetical protein